MSNAQNGTLKEKKDLNDIEAIIEKAIKKIGAKKENELCKYLPMSSGGYMHHFTLKKMKSKKPEDLAKLLKKFVIQKEEPSVIAPKPRAARGSRKRKDQLLFTRSQLERMLNIARLAGDTEIISVLSPKKSLATCKRNLILSIKQNQVDQDLWNMYTECVTGMQEATDSTHKSNA
ncbi:MAG: hypothetical protein AAGF04_00690 [Chlamydiota bacterium]